MASPRLRSLDLKGKTFLVADTHPEFWSDFTSRRWEPETFALFDHYITPETVHLDVGTWIGPTVLYASTRAAQVIGFEPDPVAFALVSQTIAANPELSHVSVYPIAIAARSGEISMGSRDAIGDSMSSSLFADQQLCWHAQARRLEEFENKWPASAPIFLKIDIEGGEYALLPALVDFVRRRRPTMYISLHSDFFLGDSTSSGLLRKIYHELRLFTHFIRFWPLLKQYPHIYTETGKKLSRWQLFHRTVWRRTYALILADQPLPKNFP